MINSLLENKHTKKFSIYYLSLENITIKQWKKIKSFIVNINNCLNGMFSSFDSLNCEFSPGLKFVDNFPSCFYFY